MNKKGFTKMEIAIIICLALALIAAIGFCIFRVWVFSNYGDTPVTEMPAWVWWVMQGT